MTIARALFLKDNRALARIFHSISSTRCNHLGRLARKVVRSLDVDRIDLAEPIKAAISELHPEDSLHLASLIAKEAADLRSDAERRQIREVLLQLIKGANDSKLARKPELRPLVGDVSQLTKHPEYYLAVELIEAISKKGAEAALKPADGMKIIESLNNRDLRCLDVADMAETLRRLANLVKNIYQGPKVVERLIFASALSCLGQRLVDEIGCAVNKEELLLFKTIASLPIDYLAKMNPLVYIQLENSYKEAMVNGSEKEKAILNNNLAILKYQWCLGKNAAMKDNYSEENLKQDLKIPLAHLEVALQHSRQDEAFITQINANIDSIKGQTLEFPDRNLHNTKEALPDLRSTARLYPLI